MNASGVDGTTGGLDEKTNATTTAVANSTEEVSDPPLTVNASGVDHTTGGSDEKTTKESPAVCVPPTNPNISKSPGTPPEKPTLFPVLSSFTRENPELGCNFVAYLNRFHGCSSLVSSKVLPQGQRDVLAFWNCDVKNLGSKVAALNMSKAVAISKSTEERYGDCDSFLDIPPDPFPIAVCKHYSLFSGKPFPLGIPRTKTKDYEGFANQEGMYTEDGMLTSKGEDTWHYCRAVNNRLSSLDVKGLVHILEETISWYLYLEKQNNIELQINNTGFTDLIARYGKEQDCERIENMLTSCENELKKSNRTFVYTLDLITSNLENITQQLRAIKGRDEDVTALKEEAKSKKRLLEEAKSWYHYRDALYFLHNLLQASSRSLFEYCHKVDLVLMPEGNEYMKAPEGWDKFGMYEKGKLTTLGLKTIRLCTSLSGHIRKAKRQMPTHFSSSYY